MLSLYQPFMYLKKISCPLLFFRPHNLNSSNCFWESAVPKPLLISAAVGVPASSWHSCIAATKTDAVLQLGPCAEESKFLRTFLYIPV